MVTTGVVMDRRDFFSASVAAAATVATGDAVAAQKSNVVRIDRRYNDPRLSRPIPLNKDRAREVLTELGIDGLVALRPHNVFYLANTVPVLTPFGEEYPGFAPFARDPQQPSFLLTSTGNTWETANGEREVPEVITYAAPRNWQEYLDASAAQRRIEPESAGKNRSEEHTSEPPVTQ